ncbi:MAG: ribosome small subunit-dependent GTPase A [Eubacteriales bacterium]|nr:ribosome small subunit-dependent GTPase A [Eubacteriales bacterium]
MAKGRIIEGRGGLYTVRDAVGQSYILRAKNKFRRENITPLVGDLVEFIPTRGAEHGWIEEILPRNSYSIRPPVANITQLVITLATEPAPDLILVDKLLLFAFGQQIVPLIVVNKVDLEPRLAREIKIAYDLTGVEVLALSAKTSEGMDDLQAAMAGHITCFAGQSGVGKSTLIMALTGVSLETGEISQKIRRGKQTTRHISLIEQGGLKVLDTPGFSLLDLPEELEPEEIRLCYPDFTPYSHQCRFAPCLHDQEPDCAVDEAARNGLIDLGRLERYRELLNQAQEKWRTRYD